MAREGGWRRECPEAVRRAQAEVLEAPRPQLFLVRQAGPAAFVIKDAKRKNPVHVLLSGRHTCTCSDFRAHKELCAHICWALLKKLQLRPDNPLSYQAGLTSLEIAEAVQRTAAAVEPPVTTPAAHAAVKAEEAASNTLPEVPGRPVTASSVCAICLEELLATRGPVTRCRHGCGNAVHIHCMQVVADHQMESRRYTAPDSWITCPLCRGHFCTLASLRQQGRNAAGERSPMRAQRAQRARFSQRMLIPIAQTQHTDLTCASCGQHPVRGAAFRCAKCPSVVLCVACATEPAARALHGAHGIVVKQVAGDRWQRLTDSKLSAALTETSGSRSAPLSKELLRLVPVSKLRADHRLLAPGRQCCLCLNPYKERDRVRTLPCGHDFHAACAADWLLHKSGACPTDGVLLRPLLLHRLLMSSTEAAIPTSRRPLPQEFTKRCQQMRPPLHRATSESRRRDRSTLGVPCMRPLSRSLDRARTSKALEFTAVLTCTRLL